MGYDVDKETRMLIINPFEADAVKMIFSMYLDGCTYGDIKTALNERGVTTKWGAPFGSNSLHSILKNPKYTGVYTYSRSAPKNADGKRNGSAYKDDEDIIKVEGAVPALVSTEDFDRVQVLLGQRKQRVAKHRAKRTYLLSGKIFCDECGFAYVGNCRPARTDHPEYLSYRCNNRTKRPRCNGWEIRAEMIESIVLGELANIIFNDDIIPKISEGYRQYLNEQNREGVVVQEELIRQIASVQKDMDSIMAVIIKTASDALVSRLNELDAQKKELGHRLNETQKQNDAPGMSIVELTETFHQAREMLRTGKLSTVKALIERYVNRVVIGGDNIEVQLNLEISNRTATYAENLDNRKTPQIILQDDSEVFSDSGRSLLATCSGATPSKYEPKNPLRIGASPLSSASIAASSSARDITFMPSFQLNDITNLSSNTNIELMNISITDSLYTGSSTFPFLNRLTQNTIPFFERGVL